MDVDATEELRERVERAQAAIAERPELDLRLAELTPLQEATEALKAKVCREEMKMGLCGREGSHGVGPCFRVFLRRMARARVCRSTLPLYIHILRCLR